MVTKQIGLHDLEGKIKLISFEYIRFLFYKWIRLQYCYDIFMQVFEVIISKEFWIVYEFDILPKFFIHIESRANTPWLMFCWKFNNFCNLVTEIAKINPISTEELCYAINNALSLVGYPYFETIK